MGEEGSSRYDCCFFIAQGCDAQGRVRKLAAKAARAPRGEPCYAQKAEGK